MALIECPECSKEVSDTAETCTHCGFSLETASVAEGIGALVVLAMAILAIGYAGYALFLS